MYQFANETYFDEKAFSNEGTGEKSLTRLLKSPGLLVSASAVPSSHKKNSFSKTEFLSSDPSELCDRLSFFLQKNEAEIILT